MNLTMGSQTFVNVQIPVLWGTRAIVQDREGRLSVIDLAGEEARLEILGDKPAPGVEYRPVIGGFAILRHEEPLYQYYPEEKLLTSVNLNLPECQIGPWEIRVGTNRFSGNTFVGAEVGIIVQENSIAMGAPLPSNLATLTV